MKVLEKSIEAAAINKIKLRWPTVQVRKLNGFGFRSWPDRAFFLPLGALVMIEFKRLGEAATPAQHHVHSLLKKLGFKIYVCDKVEEAVTICENAVHAAKLSKKKHKVFR